MLVFKLEGEADHTCVSLLAEGSSLTLVWTGCLDEELGSYQCQDPQPRGTQTFFFLCGLVNIILKIFIRCQFILWPVFMNRICV